MEEKIKRLKEYLNKMYKGMDSGSAGMWAVGQEEIWKFYTTQEIEDNVDVFTAEKRSGNWLFIPFNQSGKEKKNMTFNFSAEVLEKLKNIADHDHRSQAGELEFLISERWKDIQAE